MQRQDELAIVVRARDFATQTLEKVKSSAAGIGDMVGSMSGKWMALGLAVGAAVMVIKKAWDVAETAAMFAEQKRYLDRLAAAYGTTADSVVANIERMSKGKIGESSSVPAAAKLLSEGMKPDQIYELARASEVLANVTGEPAAAAFEKFASKIAGAKNAGEQYRAVMAQADAVQKAVGNSTDTVADKMERARVQAENLRLVAQNLVLRAGIGLLSLFQQLAAGALGLGAALAAPVALLTAMTDALGITEGKFEKVVGFSEILVDAAKYTASQAKDNFSLMLNGLSEGGSKAVAGARTELERLWKDGTDQYRKQIEDSQGKIDQMYAQHGAARARTEGEFTRAKIREFETANQVMFDELPEEYRRRFLSVVKSDWEKTALAQAKASEQMFAEMARQAAATATAVSLAQAQAATAAAEEAVRHQMDLDELRFDAYELRESELIDRRAKNEQRLLEIRRNALLDQAAATDDQAELIRLSAEYGRLQEQILRIEELRAYRVSAVLTRENRDQLENARKIRQETEALGLSGSRAAVHDLRSAYEDDVAAHRDMAYRKVITWSEYDAWMVAREKRLAEDLKEIEGGYLDGAKRAIEDYIGYAKNMYAQGRDFFSGMLGDMEDALTRFGMTGKARFRAFADSVIAELMRIAVRAAVVAPLAQLFGFAIGGGSTASTGISLAGANIGFSGLPSSGGSWFGGARADGGPVQAGRIYLVGERGPEPFIPTTSGTIIPNHALGGNTTINITVPVSMGEPGSWAVTRGASGSAAETARSLSELVRRKVTEVLLEQTRAGGLLYAG